MNIRIEYPVRLANLGNLFIGTVETSGQRVLLEKISKEKIPDEIIKLSNKMSNKNILYIHSIFHQGNDTYIVHDFINNPATLREFLLTSREPFVYFNIAIEIASVILELHNNNMSFGGIEIDNILMKDSTPIIFDLKKICVYDGSSSKINCKKDSKNEDIKSLAKILYLLVNHTDFSDEKSVSGFTDIDKLINSILIENEYRKIQLILDELRKFYLEL